MEIWQKWQNIQALKLSNIQNRDLDKLDISKQKNEEQKNEEQETETLPTFPETIYSLLPDFLRQITCYANSREDADLLLLGQGNRTKF
jgi:hypothetical protein